MPRLGVIISVKALVPYKFVSELRRVCEGTRPTRQKVLPYPTVGIPSASITAQALSAQDE